MNETNYVIVNNSSLIKEMVLLENVGESTKKKLRCFLLVGFFSKYTPHSDKLSWVVVCSTKFSNGHRISHQQDVHSLIIPGTVNLMNFPPVIMLLQGSGDLKVGRLSGWT